ncbi:MAG: hypothetical protein LBL66_01245 [Clostridiales bacterium]|jgi:hypothetical protein|nr:hypothetical protein [Clostridiales bacterium]
MKTKKKSLFLLVTCIALIFVAGGALVYAAWVSNTKSEGNTVTVGSPLVISVKDATASGNTGILPGGVATFSFKAETDAAAYAQDYKYVRVTNVVLNGYGGLSTDVWQYNTTQGNTTTFTDDFEEDVVLATLANTDEVTIYLNIKLNLDPDTADVGYAGATLSFTVEILNEEYPST